MSTEKNKILILAHSFPQHENDYRGRFILDYVEDHPETEFHIIAPFRGKSFETKIGSAFVHYFNWNHDYLAGRRVYQPATLFVTLKLLFGFFSNAKKLLKKYDFEKIFACWAVPAGFSAYFLKKFCRIHYDVWLLGTDVNKFINFPFVLPKTLKNADKIYSNSNRLSEIVTNKISGLNIEILPTHSSLPNPTTPENPLKIDKENLNIAFVGRLEKVKGFDFYLEIAEKVLEKRKDVAFFAFGAGSMNPEAEAAVKKKIIKWNGAAQPTELSYYADFIDVLCITSRSESMPVVFWEFQNRCRILSFPVGDIPLHTKPEDICADVGGFVEKLLEIHKDY
ncbi:glycosyltransferase [bacterium]|nr:glycosyltransferase [bacterium]